MQGDGKSAGTRPDRGLARTGLEVAIYCSLLAAMVFVPSAAQAQVSRTDSLALVAIYDATDGDNWTDNTNWKSQEPVREWDRVTVRNGAVTGLDLSDNNLTGEIPSEIGDLTSLETLELGGNLTGAIPAEIGKLTRLEELSLGNNFTGAIPAEIGNLTNLRWLSLSGKLTGAIPTEIGKLTRLEELWLEDNKLTGAIPAEIGNLISLTNLQLHSNELTGAIPTEIGNLTNLLALDLSQNDLSGDIPAEIGNLTRLRSLGLWNNDLSGAIPAEIGKLTNLLGLSLNSNSLTGAIPAEIGKMTSLQRLSLYDNSLSGAMPAEIGKLTSLEKLWLSNNQLSGDIPAEIANLTSLDWLDLNSNTELTGELPAGLRLLPVTVLDIRNTCITTPADSDFQAWLLGIDFRYTDRVCVAAGVTVTPTALSVPEGSSAKYTVVLDAQPSADVTISLSFASGSDVDITVDEIPLTFTTENWDTAQEVTVSAAEDDDALNGAAAIEHTASGEGYDGVSVSSVTATEADNDMAGVTVTPTALTVAEGDSVQYTVVLDTKPSADVTITVSLASDSDEDITVSAGSLVFTPETWSTAQDVWIKAAEDDDAINGSATIDHAVSGGDYAGVTASSVTATEADNDTAGVTVTPVALTVAEGDSVKYTVVLDTKPSGDVTIAVSPASGSDEDITVNTPSLTFTTDNWDAAQEITVLAEEDDDALNGVATIEHSASGGDYGSVSVSSVVATEEDNDTAGVTVTPTALSVTEGSSEKYTVVLDTKPSADVTIAVSLAAGSDADITVNEIPLTFTTDNWSTAQEITVSAEEDTDAVNGVATIEHAVSGSDYNNVTASSVTVTESDNDAAGVTVNPTALTVGEGDNVKYTVVLTTRPSADVTISASLASGSDADITVDKTSLTFTPDNWNAAQEVTVSAAEDDDAINGSATIEHSVSGGDYANVTASSVTATEADNDAVGVTVTPTALSVPEGSSAKYTVVLDAQPSADVTISVSLASGSDTDITVDKTSLTFTTDNWDAAQEVTVSAAEDDDALNGAATIEHTASGGDYGSVSVSSVVATEEDNDTAGVTVTPTALAITEGSSEKYAVVLDTQPSADVTIMVSLVAGSDADITVDKTSLTFTTDNWNVAREVTVSAAEDTDTENGAATIEHSASGGGYGGVSVSSVTVTESDNDAAGVTVTPTALTVVEGDSVKYTVVLTTEPSNNVTISVSLAAGSDADITVDKTSLTFTTDNWSTTQEVTVSAAEDDDAINGAATIEHSASGGGYDNVSASSVTVTESDNDTAGVTVTPTTLSVPEGSNAKYTVVLDTQPSADVTISLSFASGSDEDITVDKTSLAFTTDNWDAAQEVTVSAAEDDDALNGAATIEHSASGGGYGGVSVSSVTATEADNDAAGVTVTPTALTVPEGSNAKYTVVLNAQPSADVTISLSFASGSDEDITVNKTSLTFTPDNWNAAQEVTVSAEEDTDTANGTATIDHTVSGGGYDNVSVSSVTATESDNDTAGVTVTPTALSVPEGFNAKYTVALDARPSADVTIAVSLASDSDEDITVDKTSLTFTPENWDAAQEITVSAAEDDDAINGAATIEHTVSGEGYGGVTVSSVTATEADNDTAGVTVTPTALTVPEGSNAKYTVVLDTQPSDDVTIAVSLAAGSDADITVDKTSLTFTPDNWDAAQEVTVSAAEDDDAINGAATIEHTVSGGGYGGVTVSSVTATEEDNDTAGVTVTPTALTVAEGGSATYTVVLDTQPSDDVTIAVSFASGSDEDITMDKTSLTFTTDNWSAVQEVTVSAAVDNDIDDDAAVLNHRASGGDYGEVTIADVVVTVTDVIGGVDVSAWLARYSRVGADHLLSSVENRMESIDRGGSGAEVSVAGQRIVFGDSPAQPGMELSGASAIWSVSQDYTTSSLGGDRGVRSGNSYGISSGLNAAASRYRNLTLRDALSRSAFRYAREMPSGNSFGVWGQGSFSRFSGSEAGADMDGDVMSGTVGIDNRFSGWLHGIAVSRSESEGAYRIAGEDSLSLSASLTGVYPYARYNLTDRLRVWGTGGYGSGSLRLQGDSLASSTSDLSMMLGSVGISGDIVSAASSGGFGLSWQTDAMLLRSSLASSDALSAVSAMVHRLRLSLESSYILRMGNRASLAPKVQLGVRQDGGDAEQGMGMDVAGGLGFIHSGWGLRAQVDMHGMVVHEDSDFEQWGVSGMILFDRSPSSELGMSLRLSPSWGSASSSMGGMRALWSRETVSGLAGFRRTGGDDRSLRLDSRFDYGFAAFGKSGVTTPYASFSVSGNEAARAAGDTDVEIGGGLGYSNRSLGLRMRAGMRGLMSEEEVGFDGWGASGTIAFDPDPSSPLGASFNVSQSWGITPRTGFGGSQTMGMREREPLPRSVTGLSRAALYGQPMRIEGEMGYGFSASGGAGVATPYAGVAFSDRDRSGLLLGFNLQAGRRFLLNVEGSTPKVRAISFDSMPQFRVRGLLKW